MWEDVYTDFMDLPKQEQQKLFNLIKEDFFSDEDEDMKDAFTFIREKRFNEGLGCVHCGSVKVKRNGKYRDRQRYPLSWLWQVFQRPYKHPYIGNSLSWEVVYLLSFNG